MSNSYLLVDAIRLNTTGQRYNAVCQKIGKAEIKMHSHHFKYFDFATLLKYGYEIYKICREGEDDIIQGMVAVKPSTEFLECANMETNNFNKRPICLYGNIGKCIVALCCKISVEYGFGGYIAFYAKNELFKYYERLGAKHLFGLRMYIDEKAAQKIIDFYE